VAAKWFALEAVRPQSSPVVYANTRQTLLKSGARERARVRGSKRERERAKERERDTLKRRLTRESGALRRLPEYSRLPELAILCGNDMTKNLPGFHALVTTLRIVSGSANRGPRVSVRAPASP
jgi:hypothetical protein